MSRTEPSGILRLENWTYTAAATAEALRTREPIPLGVYSDMRGLFAVALGGISARIPGGLAAASAYAAMVRLLCDTATAPLETIDQYNASLLALADSFVALNPDGLADGVPAVSESDRESLIRFFDRMAEVGESEATQRLLCGEGE